MNEEKFIKIINSLGMVKENIVTLPKDLAEIMNFVDYLCSYNDLETIKKMLVVLIKGE